jgi:hypothetical protein
MIWELERVPSFSGKSTLWSWRLLKGVEVDEVYGLVLDVLAWDFEVVAVIDFSALREDSDADWVVA